MGVVVHKFSESVYAQLENLVNMSPARQEGYAFQWFTMAFVVSLAWFCFSKKAIDQGLNGDSRKKK